MRRRNTAGGATSGKRGRRARRSTPSVLVPDQRVDAGRADEVVLGEAARVVRRESNADLVVADGQIGVMIFLVRDVSERIDEGDRLVEIRELVVFADLG